MYKLLPILLFAYLIAEENQEPHFIQSDSLDFIWAEEQLDIDIYEFKYRLQRSKSIDEDKFLINVKTKVYDVGRYNQPYTDIDTSKRAELLNSFPNEKLTWMTVEDNKYWRLAVYKINVEVDVDKSIELDNNIKQTLVDKINNLETIVKGLEIDDIKFNSVDIIKSQNKNKLLSLNIDDIYDNSYALIIGIDKYENVRSLDYAVKDAEDIQSMLVDKFHFQQYNIVLLKDEEATKASILQEFSNITKKAGNNDRVLIFFAGHGETQDLPDGGEMGYLLPVDGNKTDLYISAIKMDELKTLSLLSEAKHILYLIDACYGGIASIDGRGLDSKPTPDYLDKMTQDKSRQIISAGGRGEKVIEKSEWGHSAFTKNLLSGLRDSKADIEPKDGIITAQELGIYLKKRVIIDTKKQQNPKTRYLSTDEGEFVFVYAENTAVIKDKSTDDKLDYLISEMEELKSQKSSDDEIVGDKAINENSDWYKKYNYDIRGIGFSAFEDMYEIGVFEKLNKDWTFYTGYFHVGNNSINKIITLDEDISVKANTFTLGLLYNYYFTDKITPIVGIGASYSMISIQNIVEDTSDDFNIINPSLICTVVMTPFQIIHPHPMKIGVNMGFLLGSLPTSYEVDENDTIIIDNWEITLFPVFSLSFMFPK